MRARSVVAVLLFSLTGCVEYPQFSGDFLKISDSTSVAMPEQFTVVDQVQHLGGNFIHRLRFENEAGTFTASVNALTARPSAARCPGINIGKPNGIQASLYADPARMWPSPEILQALYPTHEPVKTSTGAIEVSKPEWELREIEPDQDAANRWQKALTETSELRMNLAIYSCEDGKILAAADYAADIETYLAYVSTSPITAPSMLPEDATAFFDGWLAR